MALQEIEATIVFLLFLSFPDFGVKSDGHGFPFHLSHGPLDNGRAMFNHLVVEKRANGDFHRGHFLLHWL